MISISYHILHRTVQHLGIAEECMTVTLFSIINCNDYNGTHNSRYNSAHKSMIVHIPVYILYEVTACSVYI